MIKLSDGDIFYSKCDAIVNPVNTVGVMGAGLALQFKKRFPEMFEAYVIQCNSGNLDIGKNFLWKIKNDRYIICFPTKKHFRDPSYLSYISAGLEALENDLLNNPSYSNIKSIAMPALGCGLGGLPFEDVVREILEFNRLNPRIDIELYIPKHK
jgi:O-acetyl-ADP-ribose deacetylase (regulator of RNase III)